MLIKKITSIIVAFTIIYTSLFSCDSHLIHNDSINLFITAATSSAKDYALWLSERLDNSHNHIVVGIGNSSEYGIALDHFEDDGYIIRTVGDDSVIFGKTEEGLDLACRKYINDLTLYGRCDDVVYHEGYRIDSLKLFDIPIDSFTIEYENIVGLSLAASEFQRLTRIACGAQLDISEGISGGEYTISLGISNDSSLKNHGFKYFSEDFSLIIEGSDPLGCLKGVYAFFENECGWWGLSCGDSQLAESSVIEISDDVSAAASFAFNSVSTTPVISQSFENDSIKPELICTAPSCSCTAFEELIGPYKDSICFSDKKSYTDVCNAVELYLDQMEDEGYIIGDTFNTIDLSSLCHKSFCDCDKCSASISNGISIADIMIPFFNNISAEFAEEFPDLIFKISIHSNALNIPTTAICDNLHITIYYDGCSIHSLSGSDSVSDCPNLNFHKVLSSWLDLSDNITVALKGSGSPFERFTLLDTLYYDIRYLYDLGVQNIYYDAPTCALGVQRIEYQLISLLNRYICMSESEFDYHLNLLLNDEFGLGGKYILQYIENRIKYEDTVSCRDVSVSDHHLSFNPDFCASEFEQAIALFSNASSLTTNKKQEKMCELLSSRMYIEGCMSLYYPTYYANDSDGISILDKYYCDAVDSLLKHGFCPEDMGISDDLYHAAWEDWISFKDEFYSGETDFTPTEDYLEFIETASLNISDDNLTFAFKTDTHFSYGESAAALNMFGYLQRYIPLDFYAHGGDIINGNHPNGEIASLSLSTAFESMLTVHNAPFVSLRGNHDDNSWPSYKSTGLRYDVFPKDDILNTDRWLSLAFTRSPQIVTDGKGCYGYMDHEGSKIRVLFVDTSDIPYYSDENDFYKYGSYTGHGIRNDQLNFMAEAMSFSDKGEDGKNWAILIISHVPIETMRTPTSSYRFGISDTLPRNNYAFLRLVKAYQKGSIFNETQKDTTNYGDGGYTQGSFNDVTGDFAYSVYADFSKNGPGEVIGFICGHTHTDNLATNVGKVSYYDAYNKIYPKLSDGYVYISNSSSGFSIITIDRESDGCGTIYVDKFGTSVVLSKDMIADGDNAVATTDTSIIGSTTTTPTTGSVASGHYSISYSQNP